MINIYGNHYEGNSHRNYYNASFAFGVRVNGCGAS